MAATTLGIGLASVTLLGAAAWRFGAREAPAVPVAPAARTVAPSVPAGSGGSVPHTIDARGRTSISMPAPKESIKATTDAAAGVLRVDFANLANTRSEVKIDLTTLTTHTFGNDDDASQTRHARTWLEVGDAAVPTDREQNCWAVCAIRGIDAVSADDASTIVPTREGGDVVRTVTLTTRGDLLVHGHSVEGRTAELESTPTLPPSTPPVGAPTLIEMRSKTPLRVILREHDVKPRDSFGKIAQRSFGLLGTKVADVTLDLQATLGSS
jgi:hypothetical protein